MLTIDEFSRLTHLRVRTLHRYHDAGLLEPATVDDATGYRNYSDDQGSTADHWHFWAGDSIGADESACKPDQARYQRGQNNSALKWLLTFRRLTPFRGNRDILCPQRAPEDG